MNLTDLPTPCAIVDLYRVERNTKKMAQKMKELGVSLRPHVKTHKTIEGATLQIQDHFGGITVSTLAEAHFFAKAGFKDITWAYPTPPDRLKEIAELTQQLDRFHVLIDNLATLKSIEAFKGPRLSAFLKFDCGDHRAGVDPNREESITLAKQLQESSAVQLAGILTHAGQSYGSKNADEIRKIAEEERNQSQKFAERLRNAKVEVREVSIGSTPTMNHVNNLEGITETRPGNYIFHDAFQAAIGSCSLEDVAFSVLTTIVGRYPSQNRLIVNAGALALSKDVGPTHVNPNAGYGIVCTTGGKTLPDLDLHTLSQEHGQIRGRVNLKESQFPIGERLRILPNHACLTAALFDRYYVLRGNEVVAEWTPAKGW